MFLDWLQQLFSALVGRNDSETAPRLVAPGEARQGGSAIPAVWCSTPASLPAHLLAAMAKGMGGAFLTAPDKSEVPLCIRPGCKARYYEALARLMLFTWAREPVLFHTECGRAAAVIADGETYKRLLKWSADPRKLSTQLWVLWDILWATGPLSYWAGTRANTALSREGAAARSAAGIAGGPAYLKVAVVFASAAAQGSGLGGAVMRAVCADADRRRLPLFLEAAHEGLVGFYEKYEFRVVKRANIEPDPAREPYIVPLMVRLPAAAAGKEEQPQWVAAAAAKQQARQSGTAKRRTVGHRAQLSPA